MGKPITYFVQAAIGGPIKIGFTQQPIEKRVANLQTGCPFRLRAIGYVPGNSESQLHQQFDKLRVSGDIFNVRGEWFDPKEPLVDFISRGQGVQSLARVIPWAPSHLVYDWNVKLAGHLEGRWLPDTDLSLLLKDLVRDRSEDKCCGASKARRSHCECGRCRWRRFGSFLDELDALSPFGAIYQPRDEVLTILLPEMVRIDHYLRSFFEEIFPWGFWELDHLGVSLNAWYVCPDGTYQDTGLFMLSLDPSQHDDDSLQRFDERGEPIARSQDWCMGAATG